MAGEVFISYRRADQDKARLLHALLKQRGVDAWYDALLGAGEDWRHKTAGALNAAPIFVLLFSKTASESDDISKELAAATFSKKLVIPVRIDNIKPEGAFLYELASRNWFDAYENTETRLAELADQLAALVKGGPAAEVAAFNLGSPQPAPAIKPATKPLLKQPAVLGGIALAAVALVAAIAFFATRTPAPPPQVAAQQNQRTAFFGFTAGDADPLVTQIASSATEETYTALGALQLETAARGDTQGVDLNAQLDKAAAIGARYALGGTVRTSGDQVSLTIRLDDVGTRATLWQETMTGGAAQRESLPVLAAGRASTLLRCLTLVRPDMALEDASALALVTRACQFPNSFDRQHVALWRDVERVAPNSWGVQGQIAVGWFNQSAYANDAERPAMLQESRAALQRSLTIRSTNQGPRAGAALIDIASDRPLAEVLANLNAAFQAADTSGDRTSMETIAVGRMLAFDMVGRSAEAARMGRSDAAAYPFHPGVQVAYGLALWSAGQKLEARTVLDSGIRRFAGLDFWGFRAATAITDGEDIAPILAAAPPAASVELVACWRDVAMAARATDAAARAAGGSRLLGCVQAGIITPNGAIGTLNLLGQVDAVYAITGPLLNRSNPVGFLYTGRSIFSPPARPMRADPRFLPLMRETGIYQYWLDTRTQPDVCETPEEREFEVCVALRADQGN